MDNDIIDIKTDDNVVITIEDNDNDKPKVPNVKHNEFKIEVPNIVIHDINDNEYI